MRFPHPAARRQRPAPAGRRPAAPCHQGRRPPRALLAGPSAAAGRRRPGLRQ